MIEKRNVSVCRGHELANVYDAYTFLMPIICPILEKKRVLRIWLGKRKREKY